MRRMLLIYFFVFILFSIFYLSLFHLPLLKSQQVLFYRGIIFLAVSVLIFLTGIIMLRPSHLESLIAAVMISAAIHLSLFIVFPVTFDRSVTMFLLNALKNNQLSKKQLEQRLINDYIIKNKALDKRLNEQKIIDYIHEENNNISLTQKSIGFLDLSELIKRIYNVK